MPLLERRDAPGLIFFGAWIAGCAATTWLLALAWGTPWVAPVLVVHGAVLTFSYAASHECAHGTAFRSNWLNEVAFYVTSFVFGEEPMYRRYSHGRHHAYTWYPEFDSQMPYRNPMTLRRYLRETLGLAGLRDSLVVMWRQSFGRLTEAEHSFIPAAKISQLIWGNRLFLVGYAAIAAAAVITESVFLAVAFFGARCAGGWVVQLFINSQHMCMNEAVADHRYSTRSLRSWPLTRLLYWNMNYHIEHHLYPAVPFHALPKLHDRVAAQLPVPARGVLDANREILQVIRRQRQDPSYAAQPVFGTR